ncbi:Hpt domain-containing protein [Synechocystis sp. B12]|nr:Hpt domain-containing protein [Synechocystis sp. B12]
MVKPTDVTESPLDPTAIAFLRDELCGGDLTLFGEMVACYCQESQKLIEELVQGLEVEDFALIRRTAHSLKSSSASLGAQQLSTFCQQLEKNAGSGNLGLGSPLSWLTAVDNYTSPWWKPLRPSPFPRHESASTNRNRRRKNFGGGR